MVPAECAAYRARWDRVACMRACPIAPEMLRPVVVKTVHVISFLHAQLSLVLPHSELWLVHVWPWPLLSHESAEWNVLGRVPFEPIFSRVYLMLSRVRPARLSVEQAVVRRSNLEALAARASRR